MNIIRDEELGGLGMIPLLLDWNIRRCNVKSCTNRPTTIVTQAGEDVPIFGLCENHYQQGNVPGGTHYDLEWDNFDAFAALEQAVELEA